MYRVADGVARSDGLSEAVRAIGNIVDRVDSSSTCRAPSFAKRRTGRKYVAWLWSSPRTLSADIRERDAAIPSCRGEGPTVKLPIVRHNGTIATATKIDCEHARIADAGWSQLGEQANRTRGLAMEPTYGFLDPSHDHWRIVLQGGHFESGRGTLRQRMLVRLIRRVLKLPPDAAESELFRSRVAPFFREGAVSRVRVELTPHVTMTLSGRVREGRFRTLWELPAGLIRELRHDGIVSPQGGLVLTAYPVEYPDIRCLCRVQLVPPNGVTIISDIDDTIKVSEVFDRRELLRNTFLRPFRPVPQMAAIYRRWADAGAIVHYVSSSPTPLYEPIREFFAGERFPLGPVHLRALHLHNANLLELLVTKPSSKRRMLAELLRVFPHRRFILVGDSGERDPEIYGALARRFRNQVRRIIIRRAPGRRMHVERCQRAFRGLPFDGWNVFERPEQLAELLPVASLRRP